MKSFFPVKKMVLNLNQGKYDIFSNEKLVIPTKYKLNETTPSLLFVFHLNQYRHVSSTKQLPVFSTFIFISSYTRTIRFVPVETD
jgi:hypothetical protein